VIIFKNESLAFVELEQKASGFLEFATDLQSPDFAKIAEGAGILGLTVRTPDQVEPLICASSEADGPAVLRSSSRVRSSRCPRRSLWNKQRASACS